MRRRGAHVRTPAAELGLRTSRGLLAGEARGVHRRKGRPADTGRAARGGRGPHCCGPLRRCGLLRSRGLLRGSGLLRGRNLLRSRDPLRRRDLRGGNGCHPLGLDPLGLDPSQPLRCSRSRSGSSRAPRRCPPERTHVVGLVIVSLDQRHSRRYGRAACPAMVMFRGRGDLRSTPGSSRRTRSHCWPETPTRPSRRRCTAVRRSCSPHAARSSRPPGSGRLRPGR